MVRLVKVLRLHHLSIPSLVAPLVKFVLLRFSSSPWQRIRALVTQLDASPVTSFAPPLSSTLVAHLDSFLTRDQLASPHVSHVGFLVMSLAHLPRHGGHLSYRSSCHALHHVSPRRLPSRLSSHLLSRLTSSHCRTRPFHRMAHAAVSSAAHRALTRGTTILYDMHSDGSRLSDSLFQMFSVTPCVLKWKLKASEVCCWKFCCRKVCACCACWCKRPKGFRIMKGKQDSLVS